MSQTQITYLMVVTTLCIALLMIWSVVLGIILSYLKSINYQLAIHILNVKHITPNELEDVILKADTGSCFNTYQTKQVILETIQEYAKQKVR